LFKNRISAIQRRRKKETKRETSKEGSIRTFFHGRHFPDLPCGEITIEGSSILKHCTTTTTKKSPRIKMSLKKKKRREHCSKIELVLERRREIEVAKKKTRSWRGGERVYVLDRMFVTFPTSQVEISPLKA
jgi:hypothetical protein